MSSSRTSGFSLIELVVVMVLLTILIALVAPRLTGFFHGRRLDSEARRLWALTRYAREEAITAAVPIRLWLEPGAHRYGTAAVAGYGFGVTPRTFEFDAEIEVSVEPEPSKTATAADTLEFTWWPDGTLADGAADALVLHARNQPTDAWRLTRNATLSSFTLAREATP